MKQTAFNALVNVETVAEALLLADGVNFLFNETQIHGNGTMAGYGNQSGSQQKVTPLRHKLHYYRRDVSLDAGYAQVFDILESDDTGDETKTATRPGVNRVETRDDDDRLRYKSNDWS